MSRPRVLVVDDDVLSLDRIQKALTKEGFSVSISDLIQNLESRVEAQQVDLVLIDVLMPGLTGEDVVQLLRVAQAMGTPRVVLLSPVPPGLLKTLIDTTGAAGVLQSSNDQRFLNHLVSLVRSLFARTSEFPVISERSDRPAPFVSGTHRIGGLETPSDVDELTVPLRRRA